MHIILRRVIIFLIVALAVAFILIPLYEVMVGDVSFDHVRGQIAQNIAFESFQIWKRVFTFYLALWCGKAILWALSTASIKTS